MAISPGKMVLYAAGQFGLVSCGFGAGKLFSSFYVDRGLSGEQVFPVFIYQGYFSGYFTVAGLILALCMLFDLFAGMWSGHISDRRLLKGGRRISFLRATAVPLAVLSVLVFFPPTADRIGLNSFVVFLYELLFYVCFALYAIPYLALLPELGAETGDRIKMSALMACSTAFASLLGHRIPQITRDISVRFGLSPLVSFRTVILGFGILSGICLLLTAFLVKEGDHEEEAVRDHFPVSAGAVLHDRYFSLFVAGDFLYRIASTFLVAGFYWFVTILLGESDAHADLFIFVFFAVNLAMYVPVSAASRFLGKRRVLAAAFLMLFAFLFLTVFATQVPLSPFVKGLLISVFVAVPVSVFTVVPNALVSDLVIAAERRTGINRSGIYYGIYSTAIKTGQLLASFVFPVLVAVGARAGKSAGRAGLRLVLVVSAVLLFAGFICIYLYREKEVNDILELKE